MNINEVDQSFQVKFRLLLDWYDTRLIFNNLKTKQIANKPTWKETQEIWIPNISKGNTEDNEVVGLDNLARLTISREGDAFAADETVVDETDIFQGSENGITFDRIYTKTMKCINQLQL